MGWGIAVIIVLAALVFLVSFALTRAVALRKPIAVNAEPKRMEVDPSVAERLGGAIRFPTIAYPEQERIDGAQFLGLHEHLRRSYPLVAANLEWETVFDYSLLLRWKGKSSSRPIGLLAHMDVVPVAPGTEGDWTHGGFDGHCDGQYVWGRGALDMKGHLICVLEAVESLLAEGFVPEQDVYLCFGHTEEIVAAKLGGAIAIMEELKERGIQLDFVIDEGGAVTNGREMLGCDGLLAVIGTAEKGYLDVELTCEQSGGHSSQPPKHTALGVLSQAICRLEDRPMKPRLTAVVRTMMLLASGRMGFLPRLIFANLWALQPLALRVMAGKPMSNALVRTTFAATMSTASPAANVLPQKAKATVNVRLLPGDTIESAVAYMKEVIDDPRVQVVPARGSNPTDQSPLGTDGWLLIQEQLEQLFPGVLVAPYLMVGGTDSRWYEPVCKNIYRIAPFLLTNGDLATTHATNERISLENLMRGKTFFRGILANLKD